MRIVSDRRYFLEEAPQKVWSAVIRVGDYQRWWPWLEHFDGTGVDAGEVWHCLVQPPLPYRVRFTLVLEQVVLNETAAAVVSGDIVGDARIDLSPSGDGSELRLRSSLAPAKPALQGLALIARPLVTFGHNWVLDNGARQFARRVRLDGFEA